METTVFRRESEAPIRMKTSPSGIEMLKQFEGLRLTAYEDGDGYSIGYGHHGVQAGLTITQEKAEELLTQDLVKFEDGVNSLLQVEVTQEQFDALVSYAYNCGLGGLEQTKMLDLINSGEHENAVLEWIRGWEDSELLARRTKESELYFSGIKEA